MSNGLPRESIGQTQPERNPSLLVLDAIRMTFYEKPWRYQGECCASGGPAAKTRGAQGPP